MLHNHPLDQLIHDDSLFFLEAMIPFVDYAYKKPLILLIKYQEIRALMQCFDHPDYVASCGFDCHPESSEEMMECMCRFLPGDFAGNIKNMQQMLKMMQVMQAMNDSGSQGSPPNNNCGNPVISRHNRAAVHHLRHPTMRRGRTLVEIQIIIATTSQAGTRIFIPASWIS